MTVEFTPRSPVVNRYLLWLAVEVGAIGCSLWQAGLFQQELFNPAGWPLFGQFIQASVHPDLSPALLQVTLDATIKTLAYAVCGTCFSVVLGLMGGILCSEVWWVAVFPHRLAKGTSLWLTARALLAVPRAIHELIWGLLFINLWGLDPLTAVLAIAVPFGAITAKVFSELLDETSRQPLLVLLNSGVAPLTAFLYGLLPQALLNLLSYTFYRFECSIRSAAVLGMIGAGGLGYEILLSLQSLRYEQLWTFFYALFLLNGGVDVSSAWLRQRLGCATRLDLNLRQVQSPQTSTGSLKGHSEDSSVDRRSFTQSPESAAINIPSARRPNLALGLFGVVGLLLIPFCFWYVRADFSKLWAPTTRHHLWEMGRAIFPPNFAGISELPTLSSQTIAMSVLAIALASLGGALLAFLAAHNVFLPGGLLNVSRSDIYSKTAAWIVVLLTRAILLLCRAIPAPIWALVLLFILFPGILPGAIALSIHNLGILGRLKAEVIENLNFRPLEALRAQGSPSSLVFLYGVLPLTLSRFVAYSLYRWEVCFRETVIVGLVGAGGLGQVLTEQLSSFDYPSIIVTLTAFLLLTLLVDWVSVIARQSLR